MANFRVYFNVKMLDDALLKTYVTPEIVRESSEYIESLALSYGVNPKAIKDPVPFMVSRIAQLYAYMTSAYRKALFTIGKEADNDSFALKYRLYKELLDDALAQLTEDTFTGGLANSKKRAFPMTCGITRN